MLEQVLRKILPFRYVKNDSYMTRFFILGSRGDGDDRRSIRLHHIKASDLDRDYHNHPYNFTSIMLTPGGYIENTPDCCGNPVAKKFGLFRKNSKTVDDFHRLTLTKPVWTLVFCGPRLQSWGFWSGKKGDPFIDYKEYGEE